MPTIKEKAVEVKTIQLKKDSKFPKMEILIVRKVSSKKSKEEAYKLRISEGPAFWLTVKKGEPVLEVECEKAVAGILGTVSWSNEKGFRNKQNKPMYFNYSEQRFKVK